MIPLDMLTAARITNGAPGDLFLPRDGGVGERFLIGRVNRQFTVAAMLEGERTFRFAELDEWSGRRGLLVSNYSLLVDQFSAVRPDQDEAEQLGVLFLDANTASILVESSSRTRHHLYLRGEGSEPSADSVVLTRWSLAVEAAGAWQELYSYGEGVEQWLKSLGGRQ